MDPLHQSDERNVTVERNHAKTLPGQESTTRVMAAVSFTLVVLHGPKGFFACQTPRGSRTRSFTMGHTVTPPSIPLRLYRPHLLIRQGRTHSLEAAFLRC